MTEKTKQILEAIDSAPSLSREIAALQKELAEKAGEIQPDEAITKFQLISKSAAALNRLAKTLQTIPHESIRTILIARTKRGSTMMSFRQLEQHFQLLQVIQNYHKLLSNYNNAIKAYRVDGMPQAPGYHIDKMDELIIKRERAQQKLPALQVLADLKKEQVEETIEITTAFAGKNRIKQELVFRKRYIEGCTWDEISLVTNENPTKLKASVVNALSRAERRNEDGYSYS